MPADGRTQNCETDRDDRTESAGDARLDRPDLLTRIVHAAEALDFEEPTRDQQLRIVGLIQEAYRNGVPVAEVATCPCSACDDLRAERDAVLHDGFEPIRPRSNLERFILRVATGEDADRAAVAVGGTGRPGKVRGG